MAKVDYAYYVSGGTTYGAAGNLKLVTITTPMTDSGISRVQKQYYRYYVSGDSNGFVNGIKIVMGFEGTRQFDYTDATWDDDFLTESVIDNLKPYADAYFEYDSDCRINKAFFNGECSCGGGNNGLYEFAYAEASAYSTMIGNDDYDTDGGLTPLAVWATRTEVTPPTGAAFITAYCDETGQCLSYVQSALTPSDTSGDQTYWATRVDRDATGQVVAVRSPLNITYTFSSNTLSSGAAGLIRTYERVSSGDMTGFLNHVRWQDGTSGTSYYESTLSYTSASYTASSGPTITRPFIASRTEYPVAGTTALASGSNTVDYTYTFHSSAAALMPKSIQTQHPAVSSGNNGSGSRASDYRYLRADGTVAFERTPRNIYTYTEHTWGQVTKTIQDCLLTSGDIAGADDPNTTWGLDEGSTTGAFHVKTTHSFDAQGRLKDTTMPDSRVAPEYYTVLADRQMVHLSIPRLSSGTYYGPVQYSVLNSVDEPTVDGTIGVVAAGTTSALTGWFNESSGDVITAMTLSGSAGSIQRLKTIEYTKVGHRVTAENVYHQIPASIAAGVVATDFEQTARSYDNAGRVSAITDESLTQHGFEYDPRGLRTARYITTGTRSDDTIQLGVYNGNGATTGVTCYYRVAALPNETTLYPDVRGRTVVAVPPQAPYISLKRDNLGRVIAAGLYNDDSGLSSMPDPTTTATNRRALVEYRYDERGRKWKTIRHRIAQVAGEGGGAASAGDSVDTLEEQSWFDDEGRLIKLDGEKLVKHDYDRLGREIRRCELASDNDTTYSNVYDSSAFKTKFDGDVVLEENRWAYDNSTGEMRLAGAIERFHDATGTSLTGELDVNADSDPMKFSVGSPDDIKGRIQITAYWYDWLHRLTTEATYGTNNGATFDRSGLSEPSTSDSSKLVTAYRYDAAGERDRVTNRRGKHTVFEFDNAGRTKKVIENYVDGTLGSGYDEDRITEYSYEHPYNTDTPPALIPGLIRKITAKRYGASDEVTTYSFGTSIPDTLSSSRTFGGLLTRIEYPDKSGSTDIVQYAYNSGLVVKQMVDQAGNTFDIAYDNRKRESTRTITAVSPFDSTVKTIARSYNAGLGKLEAVSQSDATPTVLDEIKFSYDGWGNILEIEQDPDSALGGGGRDRMVVKYGYAKATSGRNTVRRTSQTVASRTNGGTDTDAHTVGYVYSSSGGSHDANASRVSRVTVTRPGGSAVDEAEYAYLGAETLVGMDLLESSPSAVWRLYGATSGSYTSFDRFDRIIKDKWEKDGGGEIYRVDLTLDENSNPTTSDDFTPMPDAFDVKYTLDDLDRVTRAEEGELSGGSIATRTRDEQWGLSTVGNWATHQLDLDGDGSFGGTDELNLTLPESGGTPAYNAANERLKNNASAAMSYDAVGSLIDDDDQLYKYDPMRRLVEVKLKSGPTTIVEYKYNGLGWLIGRHSDVTQNGGGNPDGLVNSYDPWYYTAFDERWRGVATYRASDTRPKEQFVYHALGYGGNRLQPYHDAVVLRDRDANTAWKSAADSVMEERVLYCQNRRGDTVALLSPDYGGTLLEWNKYSAYGTPYRIDGADYNRDGFVDAIDWDDFTNDYLSGTPPARTDVNLDGFVDASDYDAFTALWSRTDTTGGRGVLSTWGNRFGYAGYRWDATTRRYEVRNRDYSPDFGVFMQRDPLGYLDSVNAYQYVGSRSIEFIDPDGLQSRWRAEMPETGDESTPKGPSKPPSSNSPSPSGSDSTTTPGITSFYRVCAYLDALWDAGPWYEFLDRCIVFKDCSAWASDYGNTFRTEAEANAARHLSWQVLLSEEFGEETAQRLGSAHEIGEENVRDSYRDEGLNHTGRGIHRSGGGIQQVPERMRDGKTPIDINDPRIPGN